MILSENKLREQPETLAELKALRVLHLQNNNLKTLPHALGAVVTLKEPNCTGNVGLEIVPAAWYSDTAMILWVCRLHQGVCVYARVCVLRVRAEVGAHNLRKLYYNQVNNGVL